MLALHNYICIPMFKTAGDEPVKMLTAVCQQTRNKTVWTRDWKTPDTYIEYKRDKQENYANY